MIGDPFRVVAADPAWAHRDKLPGPKRGAAKHYQCLDVPIIERFLKTQHLHDRPLADQIARDAWLFLWRVASMPAPALRVAAAWGFEPVSEICWVKTVPCRSCLGKGYTLFFTRDGKGHREWCAACDGRGWRPTHKAMGHYVRNQHEICLVCARGKASSLRLRRDAPSVIYAPQLEHSRKPDAMAELIESLVPGPRLELFGRRARPGWTVLGDELEDA